MPRALLSVTAVPQAHYQHASYLAEKDPPLGLVGADLSFDRGWPHWLDLVRQKPPHGFASFTNPVIVPYCRLKTIRVVRANSGLSTICPWVLLK